jgi:hypothetical protein
MRRLQLQPVRDRILEALYQGGRVAALDVFLQENAEVHVLAGAIRDAIASEYESQSDVAPRDFDIGITGVDREFFDSVLTSFGTRNRHGGYLLREQGKPTWDIWRLEDSIGLRKTGLAFSLENVLRSFNLNCNAVALDLKSGVFTDAGAIESIRKRRVGFVEKRISHSCDTFAAKALLLQLRFGYDVSVEMNHFIKKNLEKQTLLYESLKVFAQLPEVSFDSDRQKRVVSAA